MKKLACTVIARENQAKTVYAPNALQYFAADATSRKWKEQTRGPFVKLVQGPRTSIYPADGTNPRTTTTKTYTWEQTKLDFRAVKL